MSKIDAVLPPVWVYENDFKHYFRRVKDEVPNWVFLEPSERDRCDRLQKQIKSVPRISNQHDLLKRGAAYLVSVIVGIPVYFAYNSDSEQGKEQVPPMPLAFIIYFIAISVVDHLYDKYSERGKRLGELQSLYQTYCVDLPYKRFEKAAKEIYDRARPMRAVSVEAMAAVGLSSHLNSTVAAAGAEVVYGKSALTPWEAAIVQEAHAVGQTAKELAMPALVLGLLVFGALKAVEIGDTSILQRAWAFVW